jgi:hypothetical protein
VSALRRAVWGLYGAWVLFLLIVVITAQARHDFGWHNLMRLEPGARQMGLWVFDAAEAIGLNFSAIRTYLHDDLLNDAISYNGFGAQMIIVGIWAIATWLVVLAISKALDVFARQVLGPSSISRPSLSVGDAVTQRILAVTILIFLVIFFAPGWPAEGPAFRLLNDVMAEPAWDRESAAITAELDRQAQDWLPADLSPACRDILTENPQQAAAQTDASRLRLCGETVKSALEADATMGREPDPRTESASIRFLLAIAGLARNGQLEGVATTDRQFRDFERFARDTYPNLRQAGWRQAAQRYLGLLQYPDDRTNSRDARANIGYKLSVLAELLYHADDLASRDMAYRIAAVTGQELTCVPDAMRGATNDAGTPVAAPDLPSCLSLVGGTSSGDTSWIGLGATSTKVFIGFLLLVGLALPFIPWPGNFPYLVLYLPLGVLMALSALG